MSPVRGSRYAIIWYKLKQGEEVRISTPREFHRKLRNAIVKRKNKDIGYKFLMAEANKRPLLQFRAEGNIFIVRLKITVVSTWL